MVPSIGQNVCNLLQKTVRPDTSAKRSFIVSNNCNFIDKKKIAAAIYASVTVFFLAMCCSKSTSFMSAHASITLGFVTR